MTDSSEHRAFFRPIEQIAAFLCRRHTTKGSCTLKDEVHEGYATHKDLFFEALSIFDDVILKPVARGYNKLPEPIKNGTSNFTSNIATLLSIPNSLLQGNIKQVGHASGSFLINSTVGILGVLNPAEKLSVIIDQHDKDGKILFASQDGIRSDLTSMNLMNSYLKHPLMTFKIISAIHFEAFKLWVKGIKFVKKKFKIKNNITFES